MKETEEQKSVNLDGYEEGVAISALNDVRHKNKHGQKPDDSSGDLILKIINPPVRKAKGRDEAR